VGKSKLSVIMMLSIPKSVWRCFLKRLSVYHKGFSLLVLIFAMLVVY